jgi:hypothetical protein
MYAELKMADTFHRVAVAQIGVKRQKNSPLMRYGQLEHRDVLYAMQAIQKLIRLLFHIELLSGNRKTDWLPALSDLIFGFVDEVSLGSSPESSSPAQLHPVSHRPLWV